MFANKRVLLTGATGFLGGMIGEWLETQGAWVIATHRGANPIRNVAFHVHEWRSLDLDEEWSEQKGEVLLAGVEWVIHCAGLRGERGAAAERYESINYWGTRRLFEEARRSGVEGFVHVSSAGVCGFGEHQSPRSPYQWEGSAYHASKARAEIWLRRQWNESSGVQRLLILRPPVLHDSSRTDGFLFQLHRLVKRGLFIPIGKPRASRLHLCSLPNFFEAFSLILRKGESGIPYLIADERALTMDAITRIVAQECGRSLVPLRLPEGPLRLLGRGLKSWAERKGLAPFVTPEKVDLFTRSQVLELNELKALGYRPLLDAEEGLRRTVSGWNES